MQSADCDVIIIGGGPAGAAAATYLAQRGRRTVIVDRSGFPRYAVGESMLPYCYFPMQKIGLLEKMKASSFVEKYSVQFVRADGRQSQPFYFDKHMNHEAARTWQVERSVFDLMLLNHAREHGATVLEQTTVKRLLQDDRGATIGVATVDAAGKAAELHAPLTIDASGQFAFVASQRGWRVMDRKLRKIAIWTYYEGALRDSGRDEGATTVAYVEDKNWLWYIPLQHDRVSVGVVGDRDYLFQETRDPGAIFEREAAKNAWIAEHLSSGRRVADYRVTGDFSYRSKYCAADGVVLVGDAFAFLDPVFSSGLFLALYGGVAAAEAVETALAGGDYRARNFDDYGKRICSAIEAMRQLVYAFYNPDFSFKSLFMKYPELLPDLTDCLIGNVERDLGQLMAAMAEFGELPAPLPYGLPLAS